MKLCAVLVTFVVWIMCMSRQTEAQCARVRKNWNSLSAQEKSNFIGAVQSAMDTGAYVRFIEMHTEMMSEMEAHGQCMFLYWHRLFTLVFENMLRGQGSQFACVTLPYWDWITDNTRYVSGQCRSMGDCSTALKDLGGVPAGIGSSTININGWGVTGFCVKAPPADHFCESSTQCSRCVPRGDWNTAIPPAPSSYASVMSQIFSASSIGQMSPQFERGAHSNIHSDLDGAMATLLSPADPIFWAHHSMVDLIHVIFHKCRVGTTPLTFQQKASHPVAWSSCGRRNGGAFNPTDVITMRTGGGSSGRTVIPGAQDPVIGRFFQGVPNRFADLMDSRDLGYTYELSGITATMYSQCDGQTAVAPMAQPAPAPGPVTALAPVPVTASAPRTVTVVQPAPVPQTITVVRPAPATSTFSFGLPFRILGRFLRAATEFGDESIASPPSGKVKAADVSSINSVKQVAPSPPAVEQPSAPAAPTIAPTLAPLAEPVVIRDVALDPAVKNVTDWYSDMVSAVGGPSQKSLDEIERMMCAFQDECLGGVKDFSSEFKKTWGTGTARCKAIVDDVRAGHASISVDNWKEKMTKRFGCPMPAASSGGSASKNSPVQKGME